MKTLQPFLFFCLLAAMLALSLYKRPFSESPPVTTLPPLALQPRDGSETVHWQPSPGRVTLVNFFASWCRPCAMEHPQLLKLAKDQTLDLVGIAWNDTPQALENYLREHGDPYDTVLIDTSGRSAIALGLRGVPETFLIAPNGRVVLHVAGAITPSQRARLAQRIRELAAP